MSSRPKCTSLGGCRLFVALHRTRLHHKFPTPILNLVKIVPPPLRNSAMDPQNEQPPAPIASDDPSPFIPPFDPPLPQAMYFYTYRWTRPIDKAFIRDLYRKARHGHRQVGRTPNMHALCFARHFVNYVANWDFKYKVLKGRLNRLRLGYETFTRILERPDFHWDMEANVVHASLEDWTTLINDMDFAKAYFFEGEPDWKELYTIFVAEGEVHGIDEVYEISSGDDSSDEDTSAGDGSQQSDDDVSTNMSKGDDAYIDGNDAKAAEDIVAVAGADTGEDDSGAGGSTVSD
ncbi:UNVERIFIED_CONTAM: hypothetical protein Sradi_5684900 [Sesamum radiatum]|uniref:Myb/SANT-like domain-containing protein n=1 Tax=Sesamum radiatum TaxID=300843 RepID=A0AAW2L0F4_SESRA